MEGKTFTLTFGDQAENHKGMQVIGKLAKDGFTLTDLENAERWFKERGIVTFIVHLNQFLPEGEEGVDAYLLVAKGGLSAIVDSDWFYEEQDGLEKDKKAYMYGRVVDKKARHNLCFDTKSQEPDYENGKGRVVAYSDVPLLNKVRETLPEILGEKARRLCVEGNYYYSTKKCYISGHGDSERRRVVAVRVGSNFPLHYQWFKETKPIGKRLEVSLEHGDMYVMSEKAVGTDWKKRKPTTLRHAAGFAKVLKFDEENVVKM